MRWSIRRAYFHGQLLGTAGELRGVAALIGPNGGELTAEELVRADYARGREVVGEAIWDASVDRLNRAFEPADSALHRAAPEPH